jgi:hypothetical protein
MANPLRKVVKGGSHFSAPNCRRRYRPTAPCATDRFGHASYRLPFRYQNFR